MLPRFKVIADFPRQSHKIGHIYVKDLTDDDPEDIFLSAWYERFPAIYKRLQWWEEREEKDMPEYIKSISTGGVLKYRSERHNSYNWKNILPATLDDYNQYLNNKPINP